jgi:hypothetical protein
LPNRPPSVTKVNSANSNEMKNCLFMVVLFKFSGLRHSKKDK